MMDIAHKVDLWNAINAYAQTCGGDTSSITISDARERAVVTVGSVIESNEVDAAQRIVALEDLRGVLDDLIVAARHLEQHLMVGSVVHCGQCPCPVSGCKKALPKFLEALTEAEEALKS